MDEASNKSGWLDAATFETVIASTPLVSIDLIVQNEQGEYLFGMRNNRPAQSYWFVPGGRVQKKETLDAAFRRLTLEELGVELERSETQFNGIYEHFYQDSFFGEQFSTHYVVLAYQLILSKEKVRLSSKQHRNISWISYHEIMDHNYVHKYSKFYFK